MNKKFGSHSMEARIAFFENGPEEYQRSLDLAMEAAMACAEVDVQHLLHINPSEAQAVKQISLFKTVTVDTLTESTASDSDSQVNSEQPPLDLISIESNIAPASDLDLVESTSVIEIFGELVPNADPYLALPNIYPWVYEPNGSDPEQRGDSGDNSNDDSDDSMGWRDTNCITTTLTCAYDDMEPGHNIEDDTDPVMLDTGSNVTPLTTRAEQFLDEDGALYIIPIKGWYGLPRIARQRSDHHAYQGWSTLLRPYTSYGRSRFLG